MHGEMLRRKADRDRDRQKVEQDKEAEEKVRETTRVGGYVRYFEVH